MGIALVTGKKCEDCESIGNGMLKKAMQRQTTTPAHFKPLTTDRIRLAKNFGSLLLLRGLDFLLPLVTVPYLLRVIGIENYGLIGFSYAFALYSAAVIQYGFSTTATREIARNKNNINAIREIYSNVIFSTILLATITLILSVIIAAMIPAIRLHWALIAYSLIQSTANSLFPIWFFQGTERMSYITYLHAVAKIVTLIGIFSIIREPSDYLYVPAINALGSTVILTGALWIIAIKFKVSPQWPNLPAITKTLTLGKHAFVSQLAPTLYNNSTTFLLGLFSGGYATGIYSAATKVIDAICSLAYVASNAALPQLSRSLDIHSKFKIVMLSTGAIGTVGIIATAHTIGKFLHPTDGPTIALSLQLMSASIFFIFTTLTFGTNYLMLIGKDRTSAQVTLYTSSAFFVIALYLIPSQGLYGAIATLVSARGVMATALYFVYRRIKR